jgi:hypothetical protein
MEKEYFLFCDESTEHGRYYSSFYGGVIVGASKFQKVVAQLNQVKLKLNLYGEVKWSKVTERYLDKYIELIKEFFSLLKSGDVRVRIMFRHNAHDVSSLPVEERRNSYFKLYYQFIKHAFGFKHVLKGARPTRLRLYFDEFPENRDAVCKFKEYLLGLNKMSEFYDSGIQIRAEDITEVCSHHHVLVQCLDVVLGAIQFRLNDKHKEKPLGSSRRAARTIAKEKLYKAILNEIRSLKPGFNIGVSTGISEASDHWSKPYLHWRFVAEASVHRSELTKRGNKKPQLAYTTSDA